MTPLASTTPTPRGRSIGPGRQKPKRSNPAQPAGATTQKRSLPHPQPPRAGSVPLPLAQHPTSLTVASSTFGKYASDLLRRLRESRSTALFLVFAPAVLLTSHTAHRAPSPYRLRPFSLEATQRLNEGGRTSRRRHGLYGRKGACLGYCFRYPIVG
jgi:hypothetical protein